MVWIKCRELEEDQNDKIHIRMTMKRIIIGKTITNCIGMKLKLNWSTNLGLNYTKGKGYFEQYKEGRSASRL